MRLALLNGRPADGSGYTIHKVVSGARGEREVWFARRLPPRAAMLGERNNKLFFLFFLVAIELRLLRF